MNRRHLLAGAAALPTIALAMPTAAATRDDPAVAADAEYQAATGAACAFWLHTEESQSPEGDRLLEDENRAERRLCETIATTPAGIACQVRLALDYAEVGPPRDDRDQTSHGLFCVKRFFVIAIDPFDELGHRSRKGRELGQRPVAVADEREEPLDAGATEAVAPSARAPTRWRRRGHSRCGVERRVEWGWLQAAGLRPSRFRRPRHALCARRRIAWRFLPCPSVQEQSPIA